MNILHVSNKPVYPLVDGGCVAMAQLLKGLSGVAESIEHVFIHTSKHPFEPGAYPEHITFALQPAQTFIDTAVKPMGALKALLRGQNYNLQRFYDPDFEHALTDHVRRHAFDAIVLESLFLCGYIPALRKATNAQIVLRAHNVEHELWEQQARHAAFPKNVYLGSLAKSLKREEIAGLNSADLIWAITPEDADRFAALGIKTPVSVIPVALYIPAAVADYSCSDFFHLGSLNWEPNRLAVRTLLQTIWPQFTTDGKLHIAGSFPEAFAENVPENVIFHGFAADATHFMQTHGILVTPVHTGSGVRIKLLEALALGVPCITTPLGATGISDPENILLLAETPEEWHNAMLRLANSEDLRREFGERAQRYMENYHSFAVVNTQMSASLER